MVKGAGGLRLIRRRVSFDPVGFEIASEPPLEELP
jgi:hypothetical protein